MKRCLALLLCLICLIGFTSCSKQPVEPSRSEGDAVATISAVGDIFMTDAMLSDARKPDGSYQFASQFENVILALSASDITLGNFEGNFTGSDYSGTGGSYPDALAAELYSIGFDLLQTANSYSIFNGLSGLERTKSVIESNGMRALGTYTSEKDRRDNQVVVLEANGIRFAFVAFTKGVGNLAMPTDTQCSVDLLYEDYTSDYSIVNEAYITQVLKKAQETKPDVLIAALHWGSENHDEISQTQEQITDLMLKNGVDVIIGSHPHLIGQIERRPVSLENGTQKECIIAYSLGDFCIADRNECKTSMILNLEFTRKDGITTVSDLSYTAISTVDRGANFADRFSVMVTQTEIDLFEGNYYNRVSQEIYESMLKGLERLREQLEISE